MTQEYHVTLESDFQACAEDAKVALNELPFSAFKVFLDEKTEDEEWKYILRYSRRSGIEDDAIQADLEEIISSWPAFIILLIHSIIH